MHFNRITCGLYCLWKSRQSAKEETTEVVTDGPVSGPEDFKRLGMLIDVASSNMVKDVSYEIKIKRSPV